MLVYILISQLGFSVDKCPHHGLGKVSCPGDGDCLHRCGGEYCSGGMCHPVSHVTGGGVGGLRANCVTGSVIGDMFWMGLHLVWCLVCFHNSFITILP